MPHLQVQRPVAERIAAFYTFSAPEAQFLIYYVLKIRIFYECSLYRTGWTKLAFSSGIAVFRSRLQITAAQITIPAHRIGMNALHSRLRQHTMDRTFFALDTDVGIQLPHHLFGRRFAE